MKRYKPNKRRYEGIYHHTAKDGKVTWYVRVKGKGPFLVSDRDNITAEFTRKYRNYLISEYDVKGKLPVSKKEKTYFDKWVSAKEAREDEPKVIRNTLDQTWNEVFLPWAVNNMGNSTLMSYKARYNKRVKPHLGNRFLDEITTKMLEDLKSKWNHAGVAKSTQGQILRVLSVCFKIVKTMEDFAGPMEAYKNIPKKLSVKKCRVRTLTVDILSELLAEIGKLDKMLWYQCNIIAYAGLRPIEVLRLTSNNIELNLNQITIFDVKNPSTAGLDRWVPINKKLRAILIEMLKDLKRKSNELLFPFKLDYESFYKAADILCLNDGLDRIKDRAKWVSPYTLRHTFATIALNATGNIKRVQKLLGHKSLAGTMVYLHATDEDIYDAMDDIDRAFEKYDADRKKKFQII